MSVVPSEPAPKWPRANTPIRLGRHLQRTTMDMEREIGVHTLKTLNRLRHELPNRDHTAAILYKSLMEKTVDSVCGSNTVEFPDMATNMTPDISLAVYAGPKASHGIPDHQPTPRSAMQAVEAPETASRIDAINHTRAFGFLVEKVVLAEEPLSESLIREAHGILCSKSLRGEVTSSQYRADQVSPDEGLSGQFMAQRAAQAQMANMLAQLNADESKAKLLGEIDPYTLAARYHNLFMHIYPFSSDNGRLARIILNVLLLKYTGHTCTIGSTAESRDMYKQLLERAAEDLYREIGVVHFDQQTSHFEFAKFVLQSSRGSLASIHSWLTGESVDAHI